MATKNQNDFDLLDSTYADELAKKQAEIERLTIKREVLAELRKATTKSPPPIPPNQKSAIRSRKVATTGTIADQMLSIAIDSQRQTWSMVEALAALDQGPRPGITRGTLAGIIGTAKYFERAERGSFRIRDEFWTHGGPAK